MGHCFSVNRVLTTIKFAFTAFPVCRTNPMRLFGKLFRINSLSAPQHAKRGLTLALLILPLHVINVEAADVVIDDFENISDWSGLTLNSATRLSGTSSGSWDNQTVKNQIRKNFSSPLDVSGTGFVQFWAYSGKANGALIELVFDSENPAITGKPELDGWDYYRYKITVDWIGWRYFRIPLANFFTQRNPVGWNKINYVALYAQWGDHPALSDTQLLFDDMSFASGAAVNVGRQNNFVGADYVYAYTLTLENKTTVTQDLSFGIQTNNSFTFNTSLSSNQLTLPPGGTGEITAFLTIPASQINTTSFGLKQSANLLISSAGFLMDGHELSGAIPLPHRAHPRTVLNQQDFVRMKNWATTTNWAGGVVNGILVQANNWKTNYANKYNLASWKLPPEGGQWWHWYVSEKGVRLTYDKATGTHRDTVNNLTYDGPPYDQVVYGWMHNDLAGHARDSGLAYQLTGNNAYAVATKEILIAYADAYRNYPLHNIGYDKDTKKYNPVMSADQNVAGGARVMASVLDETSWVIPIAWAYDLVADSGVFTDQERQHVERNLLREATATIYRLNPVPWESGAPNQQTWNNAAIGMVGFALEDPLLISDAMRGSKGFEFQINNRVTSDGLWEEGSWSYHFYTLTPLIYIAEMASRSGYGDVYGNSPGLRAMFESPLRFAMPNQVLPAFNDGTEFDIKSNRNVFESPYLRYPDTGNQFATLLNLGARGRESLYWGAETVAPGTNTNLGSTLFPASGFAVLRAGSGAQSTYLAFDYGPHGAGHGHPDKLGFVSYSRGGTLGIDPGTISYGSSTVDTWYKQTLAHNTVVVGGISQSPATGNLLRFATVPALSYVAADAGAAYPTTNLLRTLVLSDDYILDRYHVRSTDTQKTVDWIYHNQGTQTLPLTTVPCTTDTPTNGSTPRCLDLPADNGYQHLMNVASVVTGNDWQTTFNINKSGETARSLRLHMLGNDATTVYTGTGLGPKVSEPVPFVMSRRQSADTTFVALMEPYSSTPAVTSFQLLETDALPDDEAAAVAISTGSYTDNLLAVAGGATQTRRTFGGSACDGSLCLVRKAGDDLTRLVISQGASVEENCANGLCQPVLTSGAVLTGFQADIDRTASTLAIYSDQSLDSGLRLYFTGAENIATVTLNGQPAPNLRVRSGHIALNEAAVSDLRITQTATPSVLKVGDQISYTLSVVNMGLDTATGVIVDNTLPPGLTLVSAKPGNLCTGTTLVRCTLGALTRGATATLTLTVTAATAGRKNNTSSVTAMEADSNTTNNTDTSTINVQGVLTVSKSGTGNGTLTSNPAGINCGADCSEPYDANAVVTLTAAADASALFTGWSGACSGSSNSCTVTMDASKTVTATFSSQPDLVVSAVNGAASGTTGSNTTINVTTANSGTAAAVTSVTGVYLSTDATITSADSQLGSVNVAGLAASTSSASAPSVTLPVGLVTGTYYLGAIADSTSVVTEGNAGNTGESNNAKIGNAIQISGVPVAPSALTATVNLKTKITLSWVDNASDESRFLIERSSNGTTFTQIGSVGTNVKTYVSSGLSAKTLYYYRVRAGNARGSSAYSNTVSAWTN